METTILFVSLFFGIFGIFSVYLLAGEFSDNIYFRYLVALIFSTAPMGLIFTTWTMSTRGLFLMMFPLVIWAMLRFFNRLEIKYLLLFCFLASGLIATHKMFVFIVPILAGIIVAHFVYNFLKNKPLVIRESIRIKIPWIYFLVLTILFITPFFIINYSWASHYFPISGNTWYVYLFETLGFIVKRYGFIIILAGLGILFILKNNFQRHVNCIFLLIVLLCFIPLFAQIMYAPEMMLTFFSILAGFGFLFILTLLKTSRSKKYPIIVIALIISALLIFSSFTQIIKYDDTKSDGYGGYMFDETFHLTSFLQKETLDLPVSGSNNQIRALLCDPAKGATTKINFNQEEMTVSLKPFPTNIDNLPSFINNLAAFIRRPFIATTSSNPFKLINAYDISLQYNDERPIDTPDNIKIYSNGFEDLWYLGNS